MKILSSYKQFVKHTLFEAEESDKYVHIGYGKYKEKDPSTGEAKADSPIYSKDDSGKFTPTGDEKGDKKGGEKGGEEVPDSQKLSGAGDFERSKDTKQDVDADMYAQDTWKQGGEFDADTVNQNAFNAIEAGEGENWIEEDDPSTEEMEVVLRDLQKKGYKKTDDDPFKTGPETVQKYIDVLKSGKSIKYGDKYDMEDDERDTVKRKVGTMLNQFVKDNPLGGKPSGEPEGGDEDADEYAISGTDTDDPAGGRGDAWMTGGDEKEKRPGGKEAEAAYHKADMMMKKYAGVDIPKAEYWAKKKKKAADAMLPEHAFSEMFKRMENR